MSKIKKSKWTAEEVEFDRAVNMSESKNQLLRIQGRLKIDQLTQRHGKEKMDAMWERIK